MENTEREQHDDESAAAAPPSQSHHGGGRACMVLWSLVKAVPTAHWVWERLDELFSMLGR